MNNTSNPPDWKNLNSQLATILQANVTVNNSIVAVDCMALTLPGDSDYWFDARIVYSAVAGADLYGGFEMDGAGAFLRHGTQSNWNGTYAYPANIIGDRHEAQYIVHGGNGDLQVAQLYGWIRINAGQSVLKFRFSQHTAQVNDCIVYAGSFMTARRTI